MTNEEAMKTIEIAIAEVEWEYPMEYAVAFGMAIDALKKQIPKKPTSVVSSYCENGTHLSHGYCPICKTLNISLDAFCGKCGQALDWS